ncbi:hypothetical protein Ato02nite_019450 [Paractinoplanes toevensis]|uniref:Uncharacterized protein n=1 Tax=Paractinoplanes toevensis TaxID=571911 RepID=A0A919VZI0_9ACTN|nr:hypothetical protein Ato02nite_019450 [Actinoplanes toevensis]
MFAEARRVLVKTGTCWLNLGDSYSTGSATGERTPGPLPAKNLNGVPWRVAFALQTAGWTLRNAVVWPRPTPCRSPSATGCPPHTNCCSC